MTNPIPTAAHQTSRAPAMAVLAAILGLCLTTHAVAQQPPIAAPPIPAPPIPAPPIPAPPIPAPAGPLGDREASIANRTTLSIAEIYISPSSTDAWGDDRLADAILEPGRTLRLRLGRLRDCAFDVLVIYEDASREERLAQNLCRARQVAFDGKQRRPPAATALQQHELALTNNSARAIQQAFISAADAAQWGEDVLARAISVGETGRVAFRGGCIVDLRVVFENRAAEERRGIDLCRRPAMSIEPGWTTSDDPPPPA